MKKRAARWRIGRQHHSLAQANLAPCMQQMGQLDRTGLNPMSHEEAEDVYSG